MDHGPLIKIVESKAQDICSRCSLPAGAMQLLKDRMTPTEYVAELLQARQFVAGLEFMAHALPTREGVWWCCLAIQNAYGDSLEGKEREAARAAVRWVVKPTSDNSLLARAPAEAAGAATPAGAAAMAAASSGTPGGFPTGRAIANAVKLASIRCEPARIADTQRLLIGLALGIAEGRYM